MTGQSSTLAPVRVSSTARWCASGEGEITSACWGGSTKRPAYRPERNVLLGRGGTVYHGLMMVDRRPVREVRGRSGGLRAWPHPTGGRKVKLKRLFALVACGLAPFLAALSADAADYPEPVEGDHVIEEFTFHTGDVIRDLNIHYYTVGDPAGEPVLLLHGTSGSGKSMLGEGFAGAMYGPG